MDTHGAHTRTEETAAERYDKVKLRSHYAWGIWKRRFHSKPHQMFSIHTALEELKLLNNHWICVSGKLGQGNHRLCVRSTQERKPRVSVWMLEIKLRFTFHISPAHCGGWLMQGVIVRVTIFKFWEKSSGNFNMSQGKVAIYREVRENWNYNTADIVPLNAERNVSGRSGLKGVST